MSTPAWKGRHRLWAVIGTAKSDYRGYTYVDYSDHPRATRQGRVLLHRLVMENHIGRYLESYEIVHHVDLDTSNNSIKNLELCADATEHAQRHRDQGTLGFARSIEWPDDDVMLRLLSTTTVGSVARELHVSRDAVVSWCLRHNVSSRSRVNGHLCTTAMLRPSKKEMQSLLKEVPLKEAAAHFDVSAATASTWCRELGVKVPSGGSWSQKDPPDREELRQLLEQSVVAAARHYGVTRLTVKKWAVRLDLTWNSKKGKHGPDRPVDGQLFRDCYAKVAAGEMTILQAETLMNLPTNRFITETKARNLPVCRGKKGTRHPYSVDVLADLAVQLVAGKLTLQAVARALSCATGTFKRRCKKHGIDLSTKKQAPRKKRPSREELLQQLEAGATCTQLAGKYQVSGTTFSKWLRYYGLESKHVRRRDATSVPSREELEQLLRELPVYKVAKKLRASDRTVKDWIRKYNITDLPPRGYWVRTEENKQTY